MKNLFYLFAALLVLVSCNQKKTEASLPAVEETETNDTTLYGVCGEGSMMHTLELITNMQDTLQIRVSADEEDGITRVAGGFMSGDRMAVTAHKGDDGLVADRVVNLTSLLGKWSSLDKNFEITDDGEVKSFVKAESNVWTSWRILNGQLLFNRDTFDIISLGADSLGLENNTGIFFYRRMRPEITKSLKEESVTN